jgi:hypothetical protein
VVAARERRDGRPHTSSFCSTGMRATTFTTISFARRSTTGSGKSRSGRARVNYELSPERHRARLDAEVRAKMAPSIEKFFADQFVGRRYRFRRGEESGSKGAA